LIEAILISRFIVDYFWAFKALSILHCILALALTLIMLTGIKHKKIKICNADIVLLVFTSFVLAVTLRSPTQDSIVEMSKFLSYLLFYFIGRTLPARIGNPTLLGAAAVFFLVTLSSMALIGVGYKQWGNAYTFTGGYYFKTDLAIAALIFLTIAIATLRQKTLLLISIVCAGYLVFKSNARIALPLVLIIPATIIIARRKSPTKLNLKTTALIGVSALIGILSFALIDFKSLGMLGFDFTDPLSAANTQGRTVIWSAIIKSYIESDYLSKLFGQGLDADIKATSAFSESADVEGFRAHNSYLYLLISVGIIGSLTFYLALISFLKISLKTLKFKEKNHKLIASISICFIILFTWLSLTTEIIIRAQLMIPLFLFLGMNTKIYLNSSSKKLNTSIVSPSNTYSNKT